MSLVTVAEVRALVQSSLDSAELQQIIDRVEAEVTAVAGAPYESPSAPILVENVSGLGGSIFVRQPILSVSAVTEYATLSDTTGESLTEGDDYHSWDNEGWLVRLPEGASWGPRISVFYVPQDTRSKRKQVVIDLVRMNLSRQAFQAESVGGEYSYTAGDWEREKWRILRRLVFTTI